GYNMASPGAVLKMVLNVPGALEKAKPVKAFISARGEERAARGEEHAIRITPARKRVLDFMQDKPAMKSADIAREAGCTPSVITGLVKAGALDEVEIIPEHKFQVPDHKLPGPKLSNEQAKAAAGLCARVEQKHSVTLLDGVPGSGKTEVYFEAVAKALERGRQALIMLPEIALTDQFMRRFEQRFGCPPVEWHSALSGPERGRVWRTAASGEARVVVGARSALFLPFKELGLIIVDEEHDPGFKQDDRVHYQARDMAVVRGNLGDFPVVLASATPSIESHVNARTGRYRHVVLPGRYSGAELPKVTAIDLRKNPPDKGNWLSPILVEAVAETLAAKQQSLLFLNRRGYAPLTLCRSCGHRVDCPQCTAWLVEHRFRGRLHCHHCGFSIPLPERCPKCSDAGSLIACGPGVERVAEEVTERFPEAKLALLSSDLIPGIVEMRQIIREIEAGDIDIIIGTQMVAKGHHFPNLATVGIVDGDLGLSQGADPRAGERTFQLLHQVTGRAGRALAEGRGFVQTHMPEHPVMEAIISGDREAFLEREIKARRSGLLPPFGRLAALIVSARDKETAQLMARDIAHRAPPSERIDVLGPAEAPIAVIRGRHRWRLLVRAPREIDVQAYLRAWLDRLPPLKGDLRLTVDIDPYSFL
ncbi:MAG: primosomal protein N', partial [Hyphomicrobiaceae bacterium]|nr:primosomal protein N' [Hyphomicrobiaceae bacterium]